MNNYILTYIKKDGKLDLQKIYEEMTQIKGYNRDKRRKELYENLVEQYKVWEKNNDLKEQGKDANPSNVSY